MSDIKLENASPFKIMLLNISPTDYWFLVYGVLAGLVTAVLGLGAIAVAKKNIREELWSPLNKWLFAEKRERNKKIDELLTNFETLSATVQEIRAEVKPNGGSSLKDAVNRIEETTRGIHKNADYTSAKLKHLDMVSNEAIFEMDIDDDGHVNCILVNPTLCELINAKESEMLGRNWLTKIVQADQKRVREEWENAVETSCPIDSIQTLKLSPRKTIQVRVQATPRSNREGVLRGFFGRIVKHSD